MNFRDILNTDRTLIVYMSVTGMDIMIYDPSNYLAFLRSWHGIIMPWNIEGEWIRLGEL